MEWLWLWFGLKQMAFSGLNSYVKEPTCVDAYHVYGYWIACGCYLLAFYLILSGKLSIESTACIYVQENLGSKFNHSAKSNTLQLLSIANKKIESELRRLSLFMDVDKDSHLCVFKTLLCQFENKKFSEA